MEVTTLMYIILTILLILIILTLAKYNKLIKYQNRVKKAQANIEIYLNKRFDLIPNLVECVKSYTNYEGSTLEGIVLLRSRYNNEKYKSISDAKEMNDNLNDFLAVVENYPNLKANTQYVSLQNELARIENELERARHIYNDEVTKYNTIIESVPSNIVAWLFAFKKAMLFKVDDAKKENINLSI